jgi:annexin A7/11
MEQALSALIESGREDLLISRCVRVHWDPYHLERVKQAYRKKFKVDLGKRMRDAVEDGNFEDFLVRMIRD